MSDYIEAVPGYPEGLEGQWKVVLGLISGLKAKHSREAAKEPKGGENLEKSLWTFNTQ